MTRLRSLLFAPGSDRRKILKLPQTAADGVIIDLEDAVAPSAKRAARALTGELVASFPSDRFTAVRVNAPPPHLRADLEAIVCASLSAVMVPKVARAADLMRVDSLLEELERERGLVPGHVRLLALIETAAGVAACESIAAAAPARLLTLVFGPGDLALDLIVDLDESTPTFEYARARVVIAARAAGLQSPIDGPYPGLDDQEGLRERSLRSRVMGFGGRLLLHPSQIDAVHAAYSLLGQQAARHMAGAVAHFEVEQEKGLVSTTYKGEFLDPPVYERMRRLLSDHISGGGRV